MRLQIRYERAGNRNFHFDHRGREVTPVAREVNFKAERAQGLGKAGVRPVELDIRAFDAIAVVEPKGRIDSVTAKVFGDRVCALVRTGENRVVIDLANVAYMSSAGFRSLLVAGKTVEQTAGQLALCGVSGEVKRLFDIGGFNQLFVICPTRAECVAKVGPASP